MQATKINIVFFSLLCLLVVVLHRPLVLVLLLGDVMQEVDVRHDANNHLLGLDVHCCSV